jgi:hypothetical protein
MSAREKSDQNFANQVIVANDDFLHLRFEALEGLLKLLRLQFISFFD